MCYNGEKGGIAAVKGHPAMIRAKIISNLEKPMPNGRFDDYAELSRVSVLRGERISFQVLCELVAHEWGNNFSNLYTPTLTGALARYTTVREVRHVPATNNGRATPDADYMTTAPCLVPDVLMPLPYRGAVVLPPYSLVSLWVDIEVPADAEAGEGDLTVTLTSRPMDPERENPAPDVVERTLSVRVIDAVLPAQEILFAQWFHSDCLASYYHTEKWSDEHFAIIEKFARTAKKNGFSMLFTPLVTPPLDNVYDTRDLQLADVTVTGDGYAFSWEKLDRFIDVADRVGIKYLEIGHLFTQGGAARATKVMGTLDGKYVRLFPKETPCDDPEYTKFLRAMLTSFLTHMRARGDDKRCYFHISDEPTGEQLATYMRAKATVADLLEGHPMMDALSHYEFYESGAVAKPVVLLDHLHEFLAHDVKGLWTYNCCAPDRGYSNRFLAMTLSRNRSIALLLYRFNIEGFLHWGYNFYYNSGSADCVNPFLDTSSGNMFPSGDPFSVYPGEGGEPLESMRLLTFHEALQDVSALKLCEALYSRDEVIAALEGMLGDEIKTTTYVNDAATYTAIRERINEMIAAKAN